MASVTKKPRYQIINDIRFPPYFSPKCIREAFQYQPRPDDVFITTYPKCGTTWMQNIITYIFRKGKCLEKTKDHITVSPYLEKLGLEEVLKMPRPGVIKTHIPYRQMPYSTDSKYIFVARNPKDCCVSLYHHTRMLPGFEFSDGIFDDFFELFIAGEVEYNDYFDHLLSWFPFRNDKNIFYITYEDMKKDSKSAVMRVAKFLGDEYHQILQRDNNVMNNILHYSSFQYMKEKVNMVYNTEFLRDLVKNDPDVPDGIKYIVDYINSLNLHDSKPNVDFVRKGIVGDWKNYLTEIQSERLMNKFNERTKGTDLYSWFF